jgi:POT family proton-dependent oligopeptide transporter
MSAVFPLSQNESSTSTEPPEQNTGVGEAARLEARYGSFLGHPKGLVYIFLSEMWERFSFYGMRALLMLYMINALQYPIIKAAHIYGIYCASTYFTGLLAGGITDRFLGARRAMLVGGGIMVAGHILMTQQNTTAFFMALALIACGTGFFKPNSTSMVGALYDPTDSRRETGYGWYYMGINIGSFAAYLICGFLGERLGWHWGFGAAAIGMTAGLIVFSSGRKHLGNLGERAPRGPSGSATARRHLTVTERNHVWALVILGLIANVAFVSSFEQAGSSLVLFAQDCTQRMIPWLNFEVPATWLGAANPFFILLLTPFVNLLWQRMDRRAYVMQPASKFALGFILLAVGFGVLAVAGLRHEAMGLVGMGWLAVAYLFHTGAELLIMPVGFSLAAKLAPKHLASLVMGGWMASVALGELAGGLLGGEYSTMSHAKFFMLPVYTALAAAIILWFLRKPTAKLMRRP